MAVDVDGAAVVEGGERDDNSVGRGSSREAHARLDKKNSRVRAGVRVLWCCSISSSSRHVGAEFNTRAPSNDLDGKAPCEHVYQQRSRYGVSNCGRVPRDQTVLYSTSTRLVSEREDS